MFTFIEVIGLNLVVTSLPVKGPSELSEFKRGLIRSILMIFYLSRHTLARRKRVFAPNEHLLVEKSVLHVLSLELWMTTFPDKNLF